MRMSLNRKEKRKMIKDRLGLQTYTVVAHEVKANNIETVNSLSIRGDKAVTINFGSEPIISADDDKVNVGNKYLPLELKGSNESLIYNGRPIDVISISSEVQTTYTLDQSLADFIAYTRELKLDASIVPAGGLVSISILAPPGVVKDALAYFLVLYAYTEDGTFRCIANSKNKIAQNAFGDWMVYEFVPESTILTGKVPILLQFRKQEYVVGNAYSLAATGIGVYTSCIRESIGGPTSQLMLKDDTVWNNWTPVLKFEVNKTENVIGHPIAIPGLIGTQDMTFNGNPLGITSVALDTGTVISGKSKMLGISEGDFIANNEKYDNIIPTVKMIRLMLQNQAQLSSIQAENPIMPIPVSTMEAIEPIPVAVATAQYNFPLITAETKELDVTPVSTKTKNDKPRKRKKRN